MGFKEKLGLIFIFSTGLASLALFIAGMFGMEFTEISVLLCTGFVLVLVVNFVSIHSSGDVRFKRGQVSMWGVVSGRNLSPFEPALPAVLLLLITLLVAYAFFRALDKPIEAYDAVSIYGLKSKMLYLAGGVRNNFFNIIATRFQGAHPDYPLLVPMSEVCVYSLLGRFDDIAVKIIFPLFYLSFLVVFYASVKRITEKALPALLFTFCLASVKQFADYATIGVADLTLGIYFGIGVIYLYLWLREGRALFLFTSSLAAILCVWTKNEGVLLAGIIIAILVMSCLRLRKRSVAHLLYSASGAAIIILTIFAWEFFKREKGLKNENFNLSMITAKSLVTGLKKLPPIIYEYQKHFFGFKKWNIVWIAAACTFFANFRKAFTPNIKYITILLIICAAGYGVMYIFSAVEIRFFLSKTGSRFLLHILPAVMFWMVLLLYERD
ncbi:MAG: hypothetical protein ISS91_04820 [Candidatus Omnitrophica bacterium]|nr:hypothetical protein [Candidatus Omnitrophota bacterium]